MKIGIITWFRHENYGTILQAIALQKYLKNIGHNTELINFQLLDGIHIKMTKDLNIFQKCYYYFGKIILHMYKFVFKKTFRNKSFNFKNVINDNCNISEKINTEKEYIELCNKYDYLIFGSDQIWNPNWYHPFYFANYEEINSNLIAYAPSFGVNSIIGELKEEYKNALNRFNSIALREKKGCEIVKELTNLDSTLVVDPTMLLSSTDWEEYEDNSIKIDGKYILCYFLSDNYNHWKAVKKYAKEKKLKLVIIPQEGHSYISSKYVIKGCKLGQFLSLIHNAEYVITDSFHGTIFSTIYRKQFLIFERHDSNNSMSQNSRIYNLLEMLKISNKLIKFNSSKIVNEGVIDYKFIIPNLNKFIDSSKKYLETVLK